MSSQTSRIVYVNGEYLPEEDAKISVFDRGFLMADAVYEVCEVKGGRMVDEERHMARLDRSLRELEIAQPRHRRRRSSAHMRRSARNSARLCRVLRTPRPWAQAAWG